MHPNLSGPGYIQHGVNLRGRVTFTPYKGATIEAPCPNAGQLQSVIARWRELVESAALRFNVSPAWIYAFICAESGGNPNAHGTSGEIGLMQIMPFNAPAGVDLHDPAQNIATGAQMLAKLRKWAGQDWDVVCVCSMYNAGPDKDGPKISLRHAFTVLTEISEAKVPADKMFVSSYVQAIAGNVNYCLDHPVAGTTTPTDPPVTPYVPPEPPDASNPTQPTDPANPSAVLVPLAVAAAAAILVGIK